MSDKISICDVVKALAHCKNRKLVIESDSGEVRKINPRLLAEVLFEAFKQYQKDLSAVAFAILDEGKTKMDAVAGLEHSSDIHDLVTFIDATSYSRACSNACHKVAQFVREGWPK